MGVIRIERPKPNLAHLVFDDPARKVNVLDEAAIGDLERALDELEADSLLEGVILRSGKPGSFIAGADVNAIGSMTDRDRVLALIRRAHSAFLRIGALRAPSVAAIDGVCLGGGAELALACDSRVASEEPHTQIGFPETLLGIFPGFGGTTRLPRLIGLPAALDLVLSGRALDARRAEKMGLIARAVPGAWLMEAAARRLDEIKRRKRRRRADAYRIRGAGTWLLEGNPIGRRLIFQRARAMTMARTRGAYPAPLAALRVMELGHGRPLAAGLELEASWVSDLVVGAVCKNLVRIFQLSERAKKDAVAAPSLEPAAIRTLALVGAGVMGGGIAEIASRSGIQVRLRDLQPASITRALLTVRSVIAERSRRSRKGAGDRDNQIARILPTLELTGFKRCDAAIEAVVEDLDVKRRVFGELEVRLPVTALLATNTSSLSITALAEGLEHPERFCGFHFFNPVHRMPLVEVVKGERTAPATLVTAVALARRLGKTPVVVNDAPGFVVNRVLMPYLREALYLLEEGYSIADIDASMRTFGMPMGPFEVVDEVGLDVAVRVAGVLSRAFPDRMSAVPAVEKLLAAGRLGRKSGLGFYRHAGKRRTPDPAVPGLLGLTRGRRPAPAAVVSERMVMAMINEAAHCLEDGVVADAGMIDLAMVFGTGFPPHRGGVLRHADTLGLVQVQARLTALRAECGERFTPARMITRFARAGHTFTSPIA